GPTQFSADSDSIEQTGDSKYSCLSQESCHPCCWQRKSRRGQIPEVSSAPCRRRRTRWTDPIREGDKSSRFQTTGLRDGQPNGWRGQTHQIPRFQLQKTCCTANPKSC